MLMSTDRNIFSQKQMSFILIFKNKYFQTHGLQNMWDLLNDFWNLLTDANFTVYWWKG